jgi:hypothetical protein
MAPYFTHLRSPEKKLVSVLLTIFMPVSDFKGMKRRPGLSNYVWTDLVDMTEEKRKDETSWG